MDTRTARRALLRVYVRSVPVRTRRNRHREFYPRQHLMERRRIRTTGEYRRYGSNMGGADSSKDIPRLSFEGQFGIHKCRLPPTRERIRLMGESFDPGVGGCSYDP